VSDVFSQAMCASRALMDAATVAAHELRLFEVLPARSDAVAGRLGVAPRRLQALLRALVLDHTLVEENGELVCRSVPPRPQVPRIGWGRLAEVIRTDRPLSTDAVDGLDGEGLRRFHQHLLNAGADAAQEVSSKLGPRGPLLDLGCGSGAYAEAFLAERPGERAIIVDRPAVLELARASVPRAEPVSLELLGGESWPRGARIALLANVLHLFSTADAARLVERAARAAEPGGTVAVKDFDAATPGGVLFSLNMALYTEAGEVHSAEALNGFFADAGLVDIGIERLHCEPDSVLMQATTLDR
jgi:hypothetical protein